MRKILFSLAFLFILTNAMATSSTTPMKKKLVNITQYLTQPPPFEQKEYINFDDAKITQAFFDSMNNRIRFIINDKEYNFKLNQETLDFLGNFMEFSDQ